MSQAFDSAEIAYSLLLLQSLKTHEKLASMDESVLGSVVSRVCLSINKQHYRYLIVFTNKLMPLGRYCDIHNNIVDEAILSGDIDSLLREISLGKDMFREVYNNQLMTPEDIHHFDVQVEIESKVIHSMIENYHTVVCDRSTLCDKTLYSQCKEMMCKLEGREQQECDTIYICDMDKNSNISNVFCANKHKVIRSLCSDVCLNPYTGEEYSDKTLNQLKDKYQLELRLLGHR